jgi:hypothetical protein
MKEKRFPERFPYFFKLESGDEAWFESMGFDDKWELGEFTPKMEAAAKDYAMKIIQDAEDHPESVEDSSCLFKEGASWYLRNIPVLESLPQEKRENAVVIAQIRIVKDMCQDYIVDEGWTIYDGYALVNSHVGDFYAGVEWAESSR